MILVVTTKLEFEGRLCKGKVLAPLTFVVLNGNRQVSCVCQCYLRNVRILKLLIVKEEKKRENVFTFFINVPDKFYKSCSYVSPGAIETSRLTQFWVENVCLLVDFREIYFFSIDENIVGYPKQVEKGTFASRSNAIYKSTFVGNVASLLTRSSGQKIVFALSQEKVPFDCKKGLQINHTMTRKEFDLFECIFG